MRAASLALLALVLAACSDSTGPGQLGRDSSEAGVFARIGDVPWGSDQGIMDTIGVWYPGFGLRVQGALTGDRWDYILTVDVGSVGTQTITPQAYPLTTTAYYNVWPKSGRIDSIKSYQSLQGRFSVISYDDATQYLVGTFEFDGVQTDGPNWTDDILPVTNGSYRGFVSIQSPWPGSAGP